MSVELRPDPPYAWVGSVQQLGRLEPAPEPLLKEGPARGAPWGSGVEAGCAQPDRCAALGGMTGEA